MKGSLQRMRRTAQFLERFAQDRPRKSLGIHRFPAVMLLRVGRRFARFRTTGVRIPIVASSRARDRAVL
jgi:hypothetical protein